MEQKKKSKLKKKITDFIKIEDGKIGKKTAVVAGAVLAVSAVSALTASEVQAMEHCDC